MGAASSDYGKSTARNTEPRTPEIESRANCQRQNEYGEYRTEWQRPLPLRNPFSLAAQLSGQGWIYFIVGFAAWTADAFDFHALSIQTTKLADYYQTTNTQVSTAITLTLLLRSVGAAFFGLAGDQFGRKWPMVINMLILGLLQIATIYSATFQQFLAVRALFGLFMGGVYGNAIAMALENCPVEARGLMSGILQQGYSFGWVNQRATECRCMLIYRQLRLRGLRQSRCRRLD